VEKEGKKGKELKRKESELEVLKSPLAKL